MTSIPRITQAEHNYLSTACLHGIHEYCQSRVGNNEKGYTWAKNPSQCKFCQAPCECHCHDRDH